MFYKTNAVVASSQEGNGEITFMLRVPHRTEANPTPSAKLVPYKPTNGDDRAKLEAAMSKPVAFIDIEYDSTNGAIVLL